jgi:hypothetical protein
MLRRSPPISPRRNAAAKEPSKNNLNTLPCVYTMRTWI